jgi:hypothetical protein
MTEEINLKILTGDSRARLLPENGCAYLVDPEAEEMFVLKLVCANGHRIYRRHRVVTGNEYRVWQQTGNVPLEEVDVGSSPTDDKP